MLLEARAAVLPTEVPERVAEAVARFLPDAEVEEVPAPPGEEERGGVVVARGRDPTALRKRIWELRIIDALRGAALNGCEGRTMRVTLSKQAAYQGRVALPPVRGPGPLDRLDLTVTLEDDPWTSAEAFAWWLCPATKDGEVVGPTSVEETIEPPR